MGFAQVAFSHSLLAILTGVKNPDFYLLIS
ncbi:hypothetical protein FHX03_006400 [Rhizobium sp. BK456]|nr:hypothetical protein [Rhizobium sp. BK456]